MRNALRSTLVAAAVAGAVAASSGVAFADDCFNASRSAQGNTSAAAHSANWYGIEELLPMFGLSPDQVAAVMPYIQADPAIPANWTLFLVPSNSGNVFELAQNAPARLGTNGKGIDHSDALGIWDALIADLVKAGIQPPGA